MATMGSPPAFRLASMAAIILSCSALWQCTTCSFAAQAFIPPVGPICRQRRIVFSSDAFLVMRSAASSNDGTEDPPKKHPPPLAFLDDRYADLFRVKKEPTSVWGAVLGRLPKHKPAAKGGSNKHDQSTTSSHPSSPRSRSPPILKLDPETGRYVVQKPRPPASASTSATHDVSNQPSNATLAQVDVEQKELVSSGPTAATAMTLQKNDTYDRVLTHTITLGDEAVEEAVPSAPDTATASITHHEASSSSSSPPPETISVHDNATDSKGLHTVEANGGSQEHQLTADLLDVVGKAFAGSSTGDDGHIATTTVDINNLTEADNKSKEVHVDVHADAETIDTEIGYVHQPTSETTQGLLPPGNEDGASNLPDASSAVIIDDKSSDDAKISVEPLAATADPNVSDEDLRIDSATHVDIDATVSDDLSLSVTAKKGAPNEAVPQLAETLSLEHHHQQSITLSEQGVRVVKSAAEAATKIAFFVGKAALTLAVAVAKAALALDEERNVADPNPGIDADELDKDATDALKMAENVLSHSSKSALFGSQQSIGREAKRTKDFFFGLFGWFNIAKLAERSAPTAQDVPASTEVIAPHPPSPPSTLAALQSLEASLSKEISAAVDETSSSDQVQQMEAREDTIPMMEIEISEKARKRQITSIEVNSAIKKAREAATKASREAEELEAMLLGLGK